MTHRHALTRFQTNASADWSEALRVPRHEATGSSSLIRTHAKLDFRTLRSMVSIRQVLALVAWEPVGRARGVQLRGPCLVHRSSAGSRAFSVHLEKNIYRCFKCDSQGNQLDLYVALTGLPLREAALDLCRRLGIEAPMRQARRP